MYYIVLWFSLGSQEKSLLPVSAWMKSHVSMETMWKFVKCRRIFRDTSSICRNPADVAPSDFENTVIILIFGIPLTASSST